MTRAFVKVLAVGLLSVLTGCGAAMRTHLFPKTWPAGLNWPLSPSKTVPVDRGPVVLVDPLILDVGRSEQGEGPEGKLLTTDVLTGLLVEQLRAEGVNALRREHLTSEPDYRLIGAVPRNRRKSDRCSTVLSLTLRTVVVRMFSTVLMQ